MPNLEDSVEALRQQPSTPLRLSTQSKVGIHTMELELVEYNPLNAKEMDDLNNEIFREDLSELSRPSICILILVSVCPKLNQDYRILIKAKALVKAYPMLVDEINWAISHKSFERMTRLEILRPTRYQQNAGMYYDPGPVIPVNSQMDAVQKAFQAPWRGSNDTLLINLMDCYDSDTPSQYSITIVASSGSGKSRLVDAVAQKKFAFPMNLREDMGPYCYGFPPRDIGLYSFFSPDTIDTEKEKFKILAFFSALFTSAQEHLPLALDQFKEGTIPSRWAQYLSSGSKPTEVGQKRSDFYAEVISAAEKEVQSISREGVSSEQIISQLELARQQGKNFQISLKDYLNSSSNPVDKLLAERRVLFFIYFDEAHSLARESPSKNHSVYYLINWALTCMQYLSLFTIFLSTNSVITNLGSAPPGCSDWSRLLPLPFTEFPFDLFAVDSYSRLKKQNKLVTLESIGKLDHLIRFGRPLWPTLFDSGIQRMVEYAEAKLSASAEYKLNDESSIAALSVCITFDFEISRERARSLEDTPVRYHLRTIFAFPNRYGTPSEPLVVEAAGRLLDPKRNNTILKHGPETLVRIAVRDGFLAKGEKKGDMIARFLWIAAHHVASNVLPEQEMQYHQPILVTDWLKALFHENWHKIVLEARPVADENGGQKLEDAFKDAYINFSHFARAGDHGITSTGHLWKALLRCMAYHCTDNPRATELVAPIHWGLENGIGEENTSPLFGHIRDSIISPACILDLQEIDTGLATQNRPILTLVHHLKHEETSVCAMYQSKPAPQGQNVDVQLRHYQILISGCSEEVYNVIPGPEETSSYRKILGITNPFDDFPRKRHRGHCSALLRQKPAFFSDKAESLDWAT